MPKHVVGFETTPEAIVGVGGSVKVLLLASFPVQAKYVTEKALYAPEGNPRSEKVSFATDTFFGLPVPV